MTRADRNGKSNDVLELLHSALAVLDEREEHLAAVLVAQAILVIDPQSPELAG